MHLVLELRRVFLDFRRFCAVSLCRKEKQSSLNIRRYVLRLFRRNVDADFIEPTVRIALFVAGKNRRALRARRQQPDALRLGGGNVLQNSFRSGGFLFRQHAQPRGRLGKKGCFNPAQLTQ